MTKSMSPATRWTRTHGTKRAHRSSQDALMHALRLNRDYPGRGPWGPYPCRWGQWYRDGIRAVPHWHVGRAGKWVARLVRAGKEVRP